MPKQDVTVQAATQAEILADAEALKAKIRTVPDWDKNPNMLYALREVGNAVNWLAK